MWVECLAWGEANADDEMARVGEPRGSTVRTEARRVETEEANDELLESFWLMEIPEEFLSRRQINDRFEREAGGLGMGYATTWKDRNWVPGSST